MDKDNIIDIKELLELYKNSSEEELKTLNAIKSNYDTIKGHIIGSDGKLSDLNNNIIEFKREQINSRDLISNALLLGYDKQNSTINEIADKNEQNTQKLLNGIQNSSEALNNSFLAIRSYVDDTVRDLQFVLNDACRALVALNDSTSALKDNSSNIVTALMEGGNKKLAIADDGYSNVSGLIGGDSYFVGGSPIVRDLSPKEMEKDRNAIDAEIVDKVEEYRTSIIRKDDVSKVAIVGFDKKAITDIKGVTFPNERKLEAISQNTKESVKTSQTMGKLLKGKVLDAIKSISSWSVVGTLLGVGGFLLWTGIKGIFEYGMVKSGITAALIGLAGLVGGVTIGYKLLIGTIKRVRAVFSGVGQGFKFISTMAREAAHALGRLATRAKTASVGGGQVPFDTPVGEIGDVKGSDGKTKGGTKRTGRMRGFGRGLAGIGITLGAAAVGGMIGDAIDDENSTLGTTLGVVGGGLGGGLLSGKLLKTGAKGAAKGLGKFVPGLGAIISGAEAVSYIGEGKYGQAGLAALGGIASFIPGIGGLVAGLTTAANIALDVKDALKENTEATEKDTIEVSKNNELNVNGEYPEKVFSNLNGSVVNNTNYNTPPELNEIPTNNDVTIKFSDIKPDNSDLYKSILEGKLKRDIGIRPDSNYEILAEELRKMTNTLNGNLTTIANNTKYNVTIDYGN